MARSQLWMEPPDNGNQVNRPTISSRPTATTASNTPVKATRGRHASSPRQQLQDEGRPLALILDLSGNHNASRDWASSRLPGASIRSIDKADLKWTSKREALSLVRSFEPDVFCVFASDLSIQSGRGALMVFAMLAGARRIVLGDPKGREVSRSRLGVLLVEAPRFAGELLGGYVLLVALSWLLTELLILAQLVSGPMRASRLGTRAPDTDEKRTLSALYIRATLTGAAEGGMPTHVAGFASGAAALGHRLNFIVSGRQSDDRETVVIEPSSFFSATKAFHELWNNLVFTINSLKHIWSRAKEIDFIYQRYSRFNWTGVVLSAITGLPLALEFNGSEVWLSRQWDPIGLLWLLTRFEQLNLSAADLIFVVSDVEQRKLIDSGISGEKIIVNPNGVDTDRFQPECGGREIRSALGIDDRVVIGFVGTFGPWHGAPVLAEAAKLMNERSGCHFIFIGTGEQRAKTVSIIESGATSATFTGSISHDRVPAYLDACDILVSPHVPLTDGSEFFGSPTKLFEYLAMEKGIIASRLGQIGEVITDGENGLLVQPADADGLARAIERMSVDCELRTRLGKAARKTAIERYTWQHNAARVFDAMNAVLTQ